MPTINLFSKAMLMGSLLIFSSLTMAEPKHDMTVHQHAEHHQMNSSHDVQNCSDQASHSAAQHVKGNHAGHCQNTHQTAQSQAGKTKTLDKKKTDQKANEEKGDAHAHH